MPIYSLDVLITLKIMLFVKQTDSLDKDNISMRNINTISDYEKLRTMKFLAYIRNKTKVELLESFSTDLLKRLIISIALVIWKMK